MNILIAVLGFGVAWLFFSRWAAKIVMKLNVDKSLTRYDKQILNIVWIAMLVLAGHLFVMFWANLLKLFG